MSNIIVYDGYPKIHTILFDEEIIYHGISFTSIM